MAAISGISHHGLRVFCIFLSSSLCLFFLLYFPGFVVFSGFIFFPLPSLPALTITTWCSSSIVKKTLQNFATCHTSGRAITVHGACPGVHMDHIGFPAGRSTYRPCSWLPGHTVHSRLIQVEVTSTLQPRSQEFISSSAELHNYDSTLGC